MDWTTARSFTGVRRLEARPGYEEFPFGSLAVSFYEIHGFASQPRGWFAVIEELGLSSAQ
jgi:hypothetical protein